MIDTIATRRINLNGKSYAKGDKVSMTAAQFNELEATGMVERAPATKAAAKPARKAAVKPAKVAQPTSATTEPASSAPSD